MPNSPDGGVEDVKDEKTPESVSSDDSAKGEDEPAKSTLDVVQEALTGSEESTTSTNADTDEGADPGQDDAGTENADKSESGDGDENATADDDADFSEEEKKHLSEKTQNRMRKLASDKKAAVEEVDVLKPRAERFDQIVAFTQRNSLTQEDVNNAFNLAALVRNEPEKALPQLKALVGQIEQTVGETLDDDLKEEVRLGYITEPRARELARERAASRMAGQRLEAEREQSAQRTARDEQQRLVDEAAQSADEWYAKQIQQDPDFKHKQARISELVELELLRTKKVPAQAEVAPLLNRIKAKVDAELKQFRPKPVPVDDTVEGVATKVKNPAPSNTMEALEAGLAAANG